MQYAGRVHGHVEGRLGCLQRKRRQLHDPVSGSACIIGRSQGAVRESLRRWNRIRGAVLQLVSMGDKLELVRLQGDLQEAV